VSDAPPPPQPPSRRKHTARIAFVAALVLAALGLGYYLADVLNPLLIALLIAYVLNPLVEALEKRRVRRTFAVTVLFGALLVGIGSALVVGGVSLADHLDEIRSELTGERVFDEKNTADQDRMADMRARQDPRLRRDAEGHWFQDDDYDGKRKVGLLERITVSLLPKIRSIPQAWGESVSRALVAQAGDALSVGVQASKGLQTFISQLWNFFGYVFLVPLYTFFLLLSLTEMERATKGLLPGLYRERILGIAGRVDGALAAFFRGRLLIAVAKGFLTWVGLWALGVRFAFFIGVVAGVLSVVPFLGMIVGGLLAVAFAYEPGSWGARCVGVLIVFLVAEGFEGAAFPYMIGRNTGLHPLGLILSVFSFGRIFGLFGVLLAVPIACVVKILFEEFALPEIKALAEEVPEREAPSS
jgi:predicted PurR-regulated permease PerM